MKTISISRLMGSEAAEIARRVAEASGYTLVNKGVLEDIPPIWAGKIWRIIYVTAEYLGSGKREEFGNRFDVK